MEVLASEMCLKSNSTEEWTLEFCSGYILNKEVAFIFAGVSKNLIMNTRKFDHEEFLKLMKDVLIFQMMNDGRIKFLFLENINYSERKIIPKILCNPHHRYWPQFKYLSELPIFINKLSIMFTQFMMSSSFIEWINIYLFIEDLYLYIDKSRLGIIGDVLLEIHNQERFSCEPFHKIIKTHAGKCNMTFGGLKYDVRLNTGRSIYMNGDIGTGTLTFYIDAPSELFELNSNPISNEPQPITKEDRTLFESFYTFGKDFFSDDLFVVTYHYNTRFEYVEVNLMKEDKKYAVEIRIGRK